LLLLAAHKLPTGPRVRLRLPHVGDAAAARPLLERLGLEASELELRRLLRFDPCGPDGVVCASAFLDGREQLVGLACGGVQTHLLLADEDRAPGVGALLEAALRERAARHAA
jgi:hypothetical protein